MRRAAVLLALPLLLAAAHGDTGTMEVVVADQLEGTEVRLEVGVLHEDGDLAEEATVTAVLTSEDGATEVGPLQLPRTTGARYGADVFLPAPGRWTARITSTGPAAEATTTIDVEPPATTTTTAPPTTTTTVPEDDDGGSSSTLGWVLAALAGAGSFLAFRRTRRSAREG